MLPSFCTCQARRLCHRAVTCFCTNFSKIPENLDFEERYLYSASSPIPIKLVIQFLSFLTIVKNKTKQNKTKTQKQKQKLYWSLIRTLNYCTRHYPLAKPWWAKSLERHLGHGQLRHISISVLCNLYGKNNSDKQHAKHVYPLLEMLNNKIKRLKMQEM